MYYPYPSRILSTYEAKTHNAVFKPESTTTNLIGPVLNGEMHKRRIFKFLFDAVITEIYRQIRLNAKHTPFQRILFRKNRGDISYGYI